MASPSDAFNPFAAALGGAGGIFNIISGIGQENQANSIYKTNQRPIYNIPASENGALNLAQSQYDDPNLPGYGALQNQLGANTSGGLAAAQQSGGNSGDIIDAISKLYNSKNQANINLGVQGAQFRRQNAANLQSQLGTQAQYEDKAFNYNQDAPYEQNLAKANALLGAGRQNVASGANSLAYLGSSAINALSGTDSKVGSENAPQSMSSIPVNQAYNPGVSPIVPQVQESKAFLPSLMPNIPNYLDYLQDQLYN
jgi:hypothetical protein